MAPIRLHILFLLLMLWAAVLIGRLFHLQVNDYGTFAAFARGQQQVVEAVVPERGEILGQSISGEKTIFASSRDWPTVFAVPKEIQDADAVLQRLRDILGLDDAAAAELRTRLENHDDPYEPIAQRITDEQAAKVKEAALSGIHTGSERGRFYPSGSRLAQTLGFVGYAQGGERRGTYGLEAYFNKELSGASGKLTAERDAHGAVLEAFSRTVTPAVPGAAITTTIDANIQYQVEKYLHAMVEAFKATGGSVIVLEPRTGIIRAIANEPTFDPNHYDAEKNLGVFVNDAVATPYEPGSVFKPITMAAALDSGAVRPETTFENSGSIGIGSYTISNVLQQYNGVRTMVDVLRYSLNTGAVFAQQKTGQEAFLRYVNVFGFGQTTGIALPAESPGSITNLSSGRAINFATASFGQGISVTPLQLAMAIGAIANGGTLMKPLLIASVDYPDGRQDAAEPTAVRTVIQKRTATQLTAIMTRVVEDGTGVRAKIPGYTIAGKTGTAQIPKVGEAGYETPNIHTFAGFFPAFNPRYVIVTKIDRPQGARYAESTAVPLFKQIAEYLITYAAIPPDQPTDETKK